MNLPPDPDEMNNDRADYATYALRAMMKETGCELDEALGDLLCNLRHWCDRNGQDFDAVNYFAAQTYEEETKEPT